MEAHGSKLACFSDIFAGFGIFNEIFEDLHGIPNDGMGFCDASSGPKKPLPERPATDHDGRVCVFASSVDTKRFMRSTAPILSAKLASLSQRSRSALRSASYSRCNRFVALL